MIIQHLNQAEQTVRRVSDDAPKAAGGASIAKPTVVKTGQPSTEQLKQAADAINQVMRQSNPSLEFEFSVDAGTKKPVIRVMNTTTGELIRQIPSEAALAIAHSIDQFQKSLLLDQKA